MNIEGLSEWDEIECLSPEKKKAFRNGINRIVQDLKKEIGGLKGREEQLGNVMQAAIIKIEALRLEYPSCTASTETTELQLKGPRKFLEDSVGTGGVCLESKYIFPEYEPLKSCLDAKGGTDRGVTDAVANILADRKMSNNGIMITVVDATQNLNMGHSKLDNMRHKTADHVRECGERIIE